MSTLTVTPAQPAPANERSDIAVVQVWFGEHLLIDWTGTADKAEWYAAGMRRRYAGLKITLNGNDW